MQLGVDFGTTRTIVAYVDRGNYPVVSFFDSDGDTHDHFPAVAALDGDRLRFGFDALAAAARGAPALRSFKRVLARPDVNADSLLTVGGRSFPLMVIMTGYLAALLEALRTSSSVPEHLPASVAPACVIAVPAHAHAAQRFLTLDAFRRAGFAVTGVINEPSAAGFEYTHRQARTLSARRTRVVVFDLGGGTFDASLVAVDDRKHEVVDSLGLNDLGGDDFDAVLAQLAAQAAGSSLADLQPRDRDALTDQCRDAKERLTPQSKRMVVDCAGTAVTVPAADFYEAAAPLVQRAVDAMEPLVAGLNGHGGLGEVAGIYLVGGGSSLPLVSRVLRDRFGRRVHRSPYPTASTAIGLAIAADEASGFSLTDRLSRGFGVFREAEGGRRVDFDPIFDRTTPVSRDTVVEREYQAAHNVGWFRFVEYSRIDADAQPRGDLSPYADVVFPFAADLRDAPDLRAVAVVRREGGPRIRERYALDSNGIVSVSIRNLDTGHRMDIVLANDGRAVPQTIKEA